MCHVDMFFFFFFLKKKAPDVIKQIIIMAILSLYSDIIILRVVIDG